MPPKDVEHATHIVVCKCFRLRLSECLYRTEPTTHSQVSLSQQHSQSCGKVPSQALSCIFCHQIASRPARRGACFRPLPCFTALRSLLPSSVASGHTLLDAHAKSIPAPLLRRCDAGRLSRAGGVAAWPGAGTAEAAAACVCDIARASPSCRRLHSEAVAAWLGDIAQLSSSWGGARTGVDGLGGGDGLALVFQKEPSTLEPPLLSPHSVESLWRVGVGGGGTLLGALRLMRLSQRLEKGERPLSSPEEQGSAPFSSSPLVDPFLP
jgi:hypothetical protein